MNVKYSFTLKNRPKCLQNPQFDPQQRFVNRDRVFYFDTGSGSAPYGAYYYTRKRQRSGKFKSVAVRRRFREPELREVWAKEIRGILELEGKRSRSLDPARRKRWEIADAIIGDADPVDVANTWIRTERSQSLKQGPMVGDLLGAFLEYRSQDAGFEENHYRVAFKRFSTVFGELSAMELERESGSVAAWIDDLPFAAETKRNHFKRLSGAFSWALKRGILDRHPFARLSAPRRSRGDVEFLSLEDVRRLFHANEHLPGRCAKLALELFGGLRTSAVSRVEWENLKFEARGIDIPGWKAKTGRRHFVEGLPPNIWNWLERAEQGDFVEACENWKNSEHRAEWKRLCRGKWKREKGAALELAGLKKKGKFSPPRNWARHTFATNHVAAFRDLALTSTLLSHSKTVEVLKEYYLGVETRVRARRFFELRP